MDFKDKTVLVAGMALSGTSSAVLLDALGANIILHDAKKLQELSERTLDVVRHIDYEDYLGRDAREALGRIDLLVVSPGLPPTLPLLEEAKSRGIPVISEIELGFQASRGDLIAITGTNGKTTTTALTGMLFEDSGTRTFVLGNIGTPITGHALSSSEDDTLVVETAALQLDDIVEYHPSISAVLNVTPDHLDRYGTMERYAAAKARVFENQTSDDYCVLNFDDPIVRGFAERVPAQVLWFSLSPLDADGVWLDGEDVCYSVDGASGVLLPAAQIRIPGRHNLQNAMAAAAIGLAKGISPDSIAHTLRAFPGVEHRIETVDTKNDVVYINDSKGTNTDATRKAIDAMVRPTVLILGGFDKHADFGEFISSMGPPVRHLVVLGETAPKIAAACEAAGWEAVEYADSFEDAVLRAAKNAVPGDAVLLSPACASWDMFSNFEERGARFKQIVRDLL